MCLCVPVPFYIGHFKHILSHEGTTQYNFPEIKVLSNESLCNPVCTFCVQRRAGHCCSREFPCKFATPSFYVLHATRIILVMESAWKLAECFVYTNLWIIAQIHTTIMCRVCGKGTSWPQCWAHNVNSSQHCWRHSDNHLNPITIMWNNMINKVVTSYPCRWTQLRSIHFPIIHSVFRSTSSRYCE